MLPSLQVRDFLLHVDCVSHHTPDFYVTVGALSQAGCPCDSVPCRSSAAIAPQQRLNHSEPTPSLP